MFIGKKTAGQQLSRACKILTAHVNHPPWSPSHGRARPALEMRGDQIQTAEESHIQERVGGRTGKILALPNILPNKTEKESEII